VAVRGLSQSTLAAGMSEDVNEGCEGYIPKVLLRESDWQAMIEGFTLI